MKKTALTILLLVFATFIFAQTRGFNIVASKDKCLALVIGNGTYKYGGNLGSQPINDAHDMKTKLEELGFEVMLLTNANLRQMNEKVDEFGKKLPGYRVGLFFYAGHGLQINGENYLVPVDGKIESESDAKYRCFPAGLALGKMDDARNDLNIVVLDACRDNPFERKWTGRSTNKGGGLAQIDAPKGTFVSFATSPGKTASNGNGRNGLFTSMLLKYISTPGLKLEDVFKNVRVDVLTESNSQQLTWESSSVIGNFYFTNPGGNVVNNNVKPKTSGFTPGTVVYDYGSISIDSKIAGSFYIDGKYKGTIKANSTGNRLTEITTGTHTLKLEGNETWTKTITVYKDQTKYVKVTSSKVKDLPGYLNDSRDGKRYKTVEIGNQLWMAENLAFETASGCWAYDNDQSNVTKYGYLYNWETAKTVCPTGWHLPSDQEWKQLEINQGMSSSTANETGWRGNAGKELKSSYGWYNSGNGNNSSGFNALPGGARSSDGSFFHLGKYANFWSSSPDGSSKAWYRRLNCSDGEVHRSSWYSSLGYSVRCIQD